MSGSNNPLKVCACYPDTEKRCDFEMLQICRYNHPNLVILLGVCPDPEHPAIIYEFMENGSLYDFLFNVSSKV